MRSVLFDALYVLAIPWWIVPLLIFRRMLNRPRPRTTGETLTFERKQIGL